MSLASSHSAYPLIATRLLEKLAQEEVDVPMLPEVAGRVVRLTQDPESDASELAKLIQSDQTLAGHVMRVANSAAYSPNSSLVSLQQAIARLGMKLIAEIALAASVNSSLFNAPGYETHIAAELRYALATGLWAKEIARASRRNVEAAFIAGLLHDIGRPVAVQAIVATARELKLQVTSEELIQLERQFQRQFGINVVEQWQMPKSVISAVRYFEDYKQPHESSLQTMIVVAGAKFVSHFMCEPGVMVCLTIDELKAQPVLGDLDLYPDDVEALTEKEPVIAAAMEAMTV